MKRHIWLLTVLFALLLTGCGESETVESTDTTAPTTETEEVPVETAYTPATLEADFGGEEFRTLCYTQADPGTMKQYLDFAWSDDKKGEVLNDAIYNRNLFVEDGFQVTIVWEETDNVKKGIENTVVAGETVYDIVQPYINDSVLLGQSGNLWNVTPLMDWEAPWWDDALLRDTAIADKLYCLAGDVTLGEEELNYGIYYNKALIANYGLESPYDLVKQGKWTIEAMYTAAQGATMDVNGDSVMDKNDAFWIGSDYGLASVLFYGTGGQLAKLSADGTPEIVLYSEQNEKVIELLGNVFCDKGASIMVADIGADGWDVLDTMLMEDRLLFRPGSIYDINGYREMISDFGILPNPKYNEQQADYAHIIATHVCPSISIPVTITGDALDRTVTLLEALGYYSKAVSTAYYDVNLTTKLARDEESADMFDIIFSTKYYDLGKVFAWGSIEGIISTAVKANGGFASTYQSAESKIMAAVEKTLEAYNQ